MKNKYENNGIEYLNIKIEDNDSYRISNHFQETFDFIEKALVNNQIVDTDYVLEKIGIKSCFQDSFEKLPSWHCRNKLIQMFFKYYLEGNENNNKVLIHCSMGVSRSPTICIMYLMKRLNLSFENVY
jgi:protein-tyrosine phosphatase